MGTAEVKDITLVVKYRSGYRCVRDGMGLIFKHFSKIARMLWLVAVAYIVCALILFHAQRHVAFADISGNKGTAIIYLLLATLLALLVGVVYQSGIAWQQRSLTFTGFFPVVRLRETWRAVLGVAWRVLKIDVVIAIVFSIFVVLCGVLLMPAHPYAVSVGRWLATAAEWAVAFCLYVVLLGASWQVFCEYILGGVSLPAAVGSLRWGRRYLGRSILLAFICTLLSVVVVGMMSLPAFVCSYIDGIALQMRLNGEQAQLPTHYPYVLVLSWILSAAGQCLVSLLAAMPMCLNWGSIRATEIERHGGAATEIN